MNWGICTELVDFVVTNVNYLLKFQNLHKKIGAYKRPFIIPEILMD